MASAWRWQPGVVSVVIPTFNRADVLPRVLAGFADQTLPADRFEVIVVDDGSTDGAPDRATAYQAEAPYPLTLLRQQNRGPAAARNAGLAQARGEVVVFVDDDCIPDPALLAEHVASHETEGLAVIGRIVQHPDLPDTPFARYAQEHLSFAYHFIQTPFDAPFACFYTGNASVHRATAQALGGFDERFPHAMHEDIDFGYRLRRHGVRFVFNDRARVYHERPLEFGPMLEQMRRSGREYVRLWAKHPELHDYLPLSQLADPSVRRQFYQAVTTYYLLLGLQEALDAPDRYDAAETLPARFRDELRSWSDTTAERLAEEVQRLHDELTQLRGWNQALEAEHHRLQEVYAAQSAWAAGLARRLEERERQPWSRRLTDWLARSRLAGRVGNDRERRRAGASSHPADGVQGPRP